MTFLIGLFIIIVEFFTTNLHKIGLDFFKETENIEYYSKKLNQFL